MSGFWVAAGEWWVHAAAAGGAVLLLGWATVRLVRQPARRQQAAGWAVRGAVLTAVLSAFPAWLLLPTPEWAKAPEFSPYPPAADPTVTAAPILPRPPVEATPRETNGVPVVSAPPISAPAAVIGPRLAERPMNPFRGDAEWVLVPADMIPRSDSRPPLEPLPEVPAVADSKPSAPAPTPAVVPAPPAAGPTVFDRVVPLLVFAYFVVAGVLLLQLVLGHFVLVRRAWAAVPLTGKARWVFDRLAESVGVRPRALVSDTIPSPICFGFARPTVLLPRHLAESLGEDELRWVLAHELEHVRRGDHRSAYWAGVARAVFFFVPWLWPVRRELGLAQEYLADAAAAEAGGRPVDYAAFLVNLSGTPLERRLARPSLASTGVRAAKSDLFRRVNMLLNRDTNLERRAPRLFAAAAGAGVLAAAVGLSGVGFADEPKKEKEPEVRVAVAVAPDEPPAPPTPPAPPAKAADVKKLKADIEKAIKDGKADEAQRLLDRLEKAVAPPAVPAPPAPPAGAPRIAVPPAPPAPPVVVGQRGDWGGFPQGQAFGGQQNWARGAAAVDLKKQFDQQMKDFDKAIKDAKDDDAREQLTKARDEYKKAMEEAVKKADEAKADIEKGQQMNRAGQQRMQEVIEAQRRLQQQLMQNLGRDFDRFQLDRLQNLQIDPNLFGNLQGGGFVLQGGQFQPFGGFAGPNAAQPRLGVRVDKVSPVLAEQLDLPKDTGLVLAEVMPGLAADKAGLKKNDVLLKLAGKDVPTDPEAFTAVVGKLKGGEKVDAVVLRKGKQTTVSGIALPEAKKAEAGGFNPFGGGANSSVQIQVNDEDVTINATADGTGYAVTGRFENGKLVPSKITVTEGKDAKTYESLDKLPEQHRGAVEKLMGRVRGLSR